jgi:hypothetical protein
MGNGIKVMQNLTYYIQECKMEVYDMMIFALE